MEYDRNLQDIFVIQSEIAQNVASKLKIILASSEKKQLEKITLKTRRPFRNTYWENTFLTTGPQQACRPLSRHFEKSVALDSNFALALRKSVLLLYPDQRRWIRQIIG